jgi:hypothetical protein
MEKQGLSLYQCVERVKGTEERDKKKKENQIESTKNSNIEEEKDVDFWVIKLVSKGRKG